ncbi:DUF262 domain-containing protein [Nocardioides salarius]|uniref:DUF262 domain-containing protein n=1 Tax=Nocardioides salarius TaxID=374513 RepID=UPI0030F656EF
MSIRESDEQGMTGYRTTYQAMFGEPVDGMPSVERVAVPLIQRDYAQGRLDARTTTIRSTFLDALHAALTGETSVGLDFIYGEVHTNGTFEPLDGQQRLTTLFLLHWYFAFRRGEVSSKHPWTNFSYATRPSARLFCERLVKHPPAERSRHTTLGMDHRSELVPAPVAVRPDDSRDAGHHRRHRQSLRRRKP